MKKFHLKGLNGLRAIAVLIVILAHCFPVFRNHMLDGAAAVGVTIFFSLSGFLITLLLIKEKAKIGDISVSKFYIRRILRIWPLYFLFIGLALAAIWFLSAEKYPFPKVLMYLLFVPNIPFIYGGTIPILLHYWSLGVEEQFYLFWPLLVKAFISRLLLFTVGFTCLYFLLKIGISFYFGGFSNVYKFVLLSRFDCMSIGAAGACLYERYKNYMWLIRNWGIEVASWSVLILFCVNKLHIFTIIDHQVAAVCTVLLIINQVSADKPLINLENRLFDFLGKISYGLYIYHPLIIFLLTYIGALIGFPFTGFTNQLFFISVILLMSVGVAYFSFLYIEKPFLRIKESYAIVKSSGNSTNEDPNQGHKLKNEVLNSVIN